MSELPQENGIGFTLNPELVSFQDPMSKEIHPFHIKLMKDKSILYVSKYKKFYLH